MLADEADSMSHAVLANHVVERGVAAAADDLGEIVGIDSEALHQGIGSDVLLGENALVGEQTVQSAAQLFVAVVAEAESSLIGRKGYFIRLVE